MIKPKDYEKAENRFADDDYTDLVIPPGWESLGKTVSLEDLEHAVAFQFFNPSSPAERAEKAATLEDLARKIAGQKEE